MSRRVQAKLNAFQARLLVEDRFVGERYAAPLAELSTGQKCTALLMMALCEGEAPIVVDQPEDSLDIRSIWNDMCLRLRRSNSSLAVASDSDKFVVFAADARHGEAVLAGAIDKEDVREEVIQLLEGGPGTYFLKQRKYNITDPWQRPARDGA
jgi:ABC-type enterochelin transport system ATPase subunit